MDRHLSAPPRRPMIDAAIRLVKELVLRQWA